MNWTLMLIVGAVMVGLLALKRLSQVSARDARRFLQQGAVVVDVRSADEFRSGHLPEAINIPLGELREEFPRQVPDKTRVVLLHCLSGTRSGIARHQLKGLGYANVFNLGSFGRARRLVSGAQES